MDPFIGRRRELELLEQAFRGPRSSFIPIYGRRRVGKSELILRFMQEKAGVYFLGKRAPAALQIREFLAEASVSLQEPLLADIASDEWSRALSAVVANWPANHKILLVFDEIQWTAAASPELLSVLQEKWDREWKRSGNVMLILCGSFVGFMERELLGRRSPLFGRRTAQIFLQPFGYHEAAQFHPGYSLVDRAKAYFICGGVPLYLRFFSQSRSIESNILRQLLDEYAPLYREPDFLLREELREVENYYAVLVAVAQGHVTPRAISRTSGIETRSLHYYLQQLVELGYLRRRYPLTSDKPMSRKVRFGLDDPLLKFWFRFVFPNTSQLLHLGADRTYRNRIRPALDGFWGECFERLCREALPHLYAREGVAASFEVGEYWSRTTQIDIVGLRDDGWTDLGECKWAAVRSASGLERELDGKVKEYPNKRNATIGRRIFVRGKVPKTASEFFRWYGLEDLYES